MFAGIYDNSTAGAKCSVWIGEELTCLCQLEIQRGGPDYHVALGVYQHTVSWPCIHTSKLAYYRHRVLHILTQLRLKNMLCPVKISKTRSPRVLSQAMLND